MWHGEIVSLVSSNATLRLSIAYSVGKEHSGCTPMTRHNHAFWLSRLVDAQLVMSRNQRQKNPTLCRVAVNCACLECLMTIQFP